MFQACGFKSHKFDEMIIVSFYVKNDVELKS